MSSVKALLLSRLPDVKSPPSRKRVLWLSMPFEYLNLAILILQGLVLIPLYLHHIGAHIYGLWLASGGMLMWLGVFDLGIGPMMNQRIARAYGEKNFPHITEWAVNGFVINLGIAIAFFAVSCGVVGLLPHVLGVHGRNGHLLQMCFLLAALAAALNILNNCSLGFLSAMLRPIYPNLSLLICRICGLSLTIVLLLRGFGLWSIPIGSLATVVSGLLFNISYSIYMLSQLEGMIGINGSIIRSYLAASPALIAGKWGGILAKDVEPFFITLFLSPEVAAAYTVIQRAGMLIVMAMNVVTGMISPVFSHIRGEGNQDRSRHTATAIMWLFFWLGIISFATYIMLNSSFVTLWVGDEYLKGMKDVIPALGISLFVFTFRNLFSGLLISSGDITMPSWMLLAEACTRLILIILMLKWLGLIGVPIAMILSCTSFSFILGYRLVIKNGIGLDKRVILYGGIVCALIFVIAKWMAGRYFISTTSWLGFMAHGALSLFVLTALVLVLYHRKVIDIWRIIRP